MHPPKVPTQRRHNPSHGLYSRYRPCLRWDFGFTCAFCLLHEADFSPLGIEGTGLSSVEHMVPQSVDKEQANNYTNVVYACRFCNGARSNIPIISEGRRLLNPTEDAWATHFQVEEDRLVPRPDDRDALYTYETYDLDEKRKVERRKLRYEKLTDSLKIYRAAPQRIQELNEILEGSLSIENKLSLIETIKLLQRAISQAYLELEYYVSIPADKPAQCQCRTTENHSLPEEFSRQMQQI
jgi:5-methylcytosine-specific restriction endonuclease McrA